MSRNNSGSFSVYRHTAPNGKVYVGITGRNPVSRWANGFGYRSQKVFFRAICKYGWDNFTHEILHSGLCKEEAGQKEVELIRYHRANERSFGYNVENGGMHGEKHSAETRMKISQANKGRSTWAKGQHFTQEHKDRLRESNLYKQRHARKVLQMTDSGEIVRVFESIRDAERKTGINRRCIDFCLRGTCMHAGGYVWKGVEE